MEITSPFAPADPLKATATSVTTEDELLDKDAFLQLLVTQLSNQDPLNPMDGQEFAAQLAQFTSVEQLTNIQSTLELNGELQILLAETTNAGIATSLIGSTIVASGNEVGWTGDGPVDLSFELPDDAATVQITITNEAGVVVRTLDVGALDDGDHLLEWDGTDDHGASVTTGTYTFEVAATDADGDTVEATTNRYGTVDRVTFGPEGVELWIGDISVLLSEVSSVES